MAETYTKEGLQGESRVSLRQIAMKELGMNARQISEMKSEAIISAILEKQGGGKKTDKKDSKADKKDSKPAPRETKPEPQDDAGEADTGALGKQLDALGKVVDDLEGKLTGLDRQQYMLFGLLSDVWMNLIGGRDELTERITELEKEFETEGNG